jgi:hypothetical protein
MPLLMGWIVMRTVRGLIEKTEISTGAEALATGVSESAARAGLDRRHRACGNDCPESVSAAELAMHR